jgi:hypothetical protein
MSEPVFQQGDASLLGQPQEWLAPTMSNHFIKKIEVEAFECIYHTADETDLVPVRLNGLRIRPDRSKAAT